MPVSSIITIISALIILSMIVSGISYSRQQAMAKRQKKISQYRQQVDEILGHIAFLLKVDPDYQLVTQLQVLAVNTLKLANNLSPQDSIISDNLRIQKQQLNNFKENKRENEVIEFYETETELNQLKSEIGQIEKLLDIYRNRGELSVDKNNALQKHLNKVNIELTINSYMNQARICGEQNNITMYQMHIKQAREVVKKSTLDESDKNKRIKELTEILNEVKKTNKVLVDDTSKPTKENHKEGNKINF
jgi:hypothetical protein